VSNIDKRALREAAERAGQNDWEYVYTSDLSAPGRGYITVGGAEAIYCLNKAAGGVKQSENVLRYIAAASPETMLALLNEIAELEQRHCGTALLEREEMHTKTLGRMLDELDAKDRRIAELELKLEAAEKRIAELRELLQWAHDTLLEINPNNYTHDDVCEINSASVEVILGIAPVLGETHGKSEEWWAARAAGTAKGE